MGLATKIKEALHKDEREPRYDDTHQSHMPGTFQDDELAQRHSDGKPYTVPHGTLVGNEGHTGKSEAGTGLNTSGRHHEHDKLRGDYDEYDSAREGHSTSKPGHSSVDSGVGLGGTGSARNPAQKDAAYWGDLSQGGQGNTRDIPERSGLRDNTGGISGSHHTDHHTGHHSSNLADSPTTTSGSHHDSRLTDQAVGGGVYNTVTGTGSPEHTGTRTSHSGGFTGDHLSSGSTGAPLSSGHAGHNYDQKTDLRGEGAPTSRNDRTGPGLAGAGAAAGAAGYAAHEIGHHGQGNTGYSGGDAGYRGENPSYSGGNAGYSGGPQSGGNTGYSSGPQSSTSGGPVPGMPHSSMLDPDAGPTTSAPQSGSGGFGTGSGLNPSTNPGTSSAPGQGSKPHFGPGHEGSKVLHPCEHCGRDNDISKYFSKDVVYRLGQ